MKYQVTLIWDDDGYAVGCPALPGCWSQGQTEADALENIADAIREYLLARDQHGADFPTVIVHEIDVA
jgi:predicted RNase H-like HicB family nuclease